MDANSSGELSMVEFQAVVSSVLRYCRPADAARLFLNFNKDPGGTVSWDELGIPRHEWVNHVLEKDLKKRQREAERQGDFSGPNLGSSPRMRKGYVCHTERIRNNKKRSDIALGMPLPPGWGQPPHFQPPKPMSLP